MKTIRIGGVPEHFNLPWHLCMDEGRFRAENIAMSWQDYPDGTGGLARDLRANKIDAAVILTEGVVKEIVDGNKLKIVQKYIASPLIWGIHVAADSSYQSLDDIQNTKAAISRFGSGSHLMAYVNAKNAGWDTKDLKFEEIVNLEGAVEALSEKKADYFLWEHFTTKPLVDRGTFRRIGDCPTPWPAFVIAVRSEYLERNAELVQKVLDVVNQVTENFKKIPGINQVLANNYQQTQADIDQWLDITSWSQSQLSITELYRVQKQLYALDLIPFKLFDDDILHSF